MLIRHDDHTVELTPSKSFTNNPVYMLRHKPTGLFLGRIQKQPGNAMGEFCYMVADGDDTYGGAADKRKDAIDGLIRIAKQLGRLQ